MKPEVVNVFFLTSTPWTAVHDTTLRDFILGAKVKDRLKSKTILQHPWTEFSHLSFGSICVHPLGSQAQTRRHHFQ